MNRERHTICFMHALVTLYRYTVASPTVSMTYIVPYLSVAYYASIYMCIIMYICTYTYTVHIHVHWVYVHCTFIL